MQVFALRTTGYGAEARARVGIELTSVARAVGRVSRPLQARARRNAIVHAATSAPRSLIVRARAARHQGQTFGILGVSRDTRAACKYDALNRLVSSTSTLVSAAETVTWTYDGNV